MSRTFRYVGPRNLLQLAQSDVARCEPKDAPELSSWIRAQRLSSPVTLTFVVTSQGRLRVSPRHAEHVACARGEPVRAAGEIEIHLLSSGIEVLSVTNQSTGYCPEASCFSEVAAALLQVGLTTPTAFAFEFVFRRCPTCQGINIVKDNELECTCGSGLPERWNFEE